MPLGPLLKSMPPLKAYAIDIVGSMTGIAAFGLMSALGTSPVVWFGVVTVLVVLLVLGTKVSVGSIVTVGCLLGTILLVGGSNPSDTWSPYYRISVLHRGVVGAMEAINVNGIPHQGLHCVECEKEPFYEQVYKWFPDKKYENVLIVGAGSGSDVALALDRNDGVIKHIDAVEIDPQIQAIGMRDHPDRPYDDPRVTRTVNDGRAFLRSTDQKYDLIVFALPDSLTLVSQAANVRLESFLFTEQAFKSVAEHLSDDGIFVLYNYYREPWLVNKLATMVGDAFGNPPLLRTYSHVMAAIANGPLVAKLDGAQPPGDTADAIPEVGQPAPRAATDDWPFLYLRTGFVADYYLLALAIILIGAFIAVALAAAATGTSFRRFSPHFFVLGMAFLLLETRSLVSFSLLFGTTWLVNALAFFGVLASVLVAIFINWKFPIRRPNLLYAMLFATIAVAWLVPPESLLIDPPELRYLLAAVLAFAPVFFANLVFSHSFRDTRTADMAFASNLLGAMAGGALEYLALDHGLPGAAAGRRRPLWPRLAVRDALPTHGRPRPGGRHRERALGGDTSPGGLMPPVRP